MANRVQARKAVLVGAVTIAALVPTSCERSLSPLVHPGISTVALSGGPNTSMVFLARTGTALIAIDLGWRGGTEQLSRRLRELGALPRDVSEVFLTHAHRDHIGAWRLLRGSHFHLAEAERPHFLGSEGFKGWIPRLAESLVPSDLPGEGMLRLSTFSRDTVFVLGHDTLSAFLVPGHTAGSAAYLVRGVLFVGDAVTFTPGAGFGSARRGYSDDAALAATNLRRLWDRLPVGAGAVRYVCTAHAHCAKFSSVLDDLR